jgi:hypothetical protein
MSKKRKTDFKTPADLERDARGRDEEAHLRHVNAVQKEVERQKALLSPAMQKRIKEWGPTFPDLCVAIDAANEACDPLRGAPIGDTMRVSVPSSEGDEGKSTRRMREKRADFQRRMGILASDMAQTFGQELPDRRDYSAHVRWHVNRERAADGCLYCLKEAS